MAKQNSLGPLLSSKKTGRILREAYDSPVGSTKRAQANAILKAHRNSMLSDGKGGTSTPISLFNIESTMPSQGGLTNQSFILSPYSTLNTESKTTPMTTMSSFKPAPIEPTPSSGPTVWSNLAKAPSMLAKFLLPSSYANVANATSMAINMTEDPRTPRTVETNNEGFPISPGGWNQRYKLPDGRILRWSNSKKMWVEDLVESAAAAGTTGPAAAGQTGEEAAAPAPMPYSSTNILSTVQGALAEGTPGALIPGQIMGSAEARGQLFPGASPDIRGTLGASMAAARDRIKQELGIGDGVMEELTQKQLNLVSMGAYLPEDMQDYIYERDQYVSKIDTMIDDIKTRVNTGAAGNDPYTKAGIEEDLNMLYYLKGKQNKRYADLINSSINAYNAQSTNLTNLITSLNNSYAARLQEELPIVESDYNNMLNTVISITQQAAQLNANAGGWLNNQLYSSATSTIGAGIDSTKITKMTESNPQLDTWFMPDGKITSFDPTGLQTKVGQATRILGIPPQNVFIYLQQKMSELKNSADASSLAKLEALKNEIISLNRANESGVKAGDALFGQPGAMDALNKTITDVISTPMYNQVKTDFPKIKEAMLSLIENVGPGLAEENLIEWRKEQKENGLSPSMISNLENAYRLEVTQNPAESANPFWLKTQTPTTRWYWFDKDEIEEEALMQNIAKAITASWGWDFYGPQQYDIFKQYYQPLLTAQGEATNQ